MNRGEREAQRIYDEGRGRLAEIAQEAILKIAQQGVPNARAARVGPLPIGRKDWSCWIITSTDIERDSLAASEALIAEMLDSAGEMAPKNIFFESQETIDREFGGSWFDAMR